MQETKFLLQGGTHAAQQELPSFHGNGIHVVEVFFRPPVCAAYLEIHAGTEVAKLFVYRRVLVGKDIELAKFFHFQPVDYAAVFQVQGLVHGCRIILR